MSSLVEQETCELEVTEEEVEEDNWNSRSETRERMNERKYAEKFSWSGQFLLALVIFAMMATK